VSDDVMPDVYESVWFAGRKQSTWVSAPPTVKLGRYDTLCHTTFVLNFNVFLPPPATATGSRATWSWRNCQRQRRNYSLTARLWQRSVPQSSGWPRDHSATSHQRDCITLWSVMITAIYGMVCRREAPGGGVLASRLQFNVNELI